MHPPTSDSQPKSSAGTKPLDPELRYSPAEAAEYLGVSEPTLAKWRCLHKGPSYQKVGRAITYRGRDLLAFEANCLVTPSGRAA